jgi:hypothetical protein
MWHLMPETDGLPHHLAHVPLKDSPLSDCGGLCGDLDIQIKLEDSVCMLLVNVNEQWRYAFLYFFVYNQLFFFFDM